jgi:thymidylate kinase
MKIDIPKDARVLIIEGVAGSGKDTLQKILKEKFINKSVYVYSEGELLFSWKQARVKGIAEIRIEFMKSFIDFVEEFLEEESESVFLLNRFHLSTYMAHVSKNPKLKKDYEEIVEHLKKLPVHIFLLQLDAEEIEKRSAHMERPGTWKKYQEKMVKKEGFTNRTERYLNEQRLMLEAAENDGIPFSLIKL